MIGLLFFAAAQATSAPPVMERAVPMARLDIPDEIAPAVVPYMRCLMGSRGVPEGRPGAARAPSVAPGTDCAPVRATAARNAEAMLAAQHRGNPQERAAMIERALAGIDGFAAGFTPPATTPENKPDSSPAFDPTRGLDVTTSFNASDAIIPAIAPYVDCFTHAIGEGSQRTGPLYADGMRRVVDQAKAGCAPVRARARSEALRLIVGDTHVAPQDRETAVDRALVDIEHMGDQLIESVRRAEAGHAGGTER